MKKLIALALALCLASCEKPPSAESERPESMFRTHSLGFVEVHEFTYEGVNYRCFAQGHSLSCERLEPCGSKAVP